MRDAAERDDGRKPGQGGDLRLEKTPAGLDLVRRRLVFGRNAANRIGNQCIRQDQSVIGPLGIRRLARSRNGEASSREVARRNRR